MENLTFTDGLLGGQPWLEEPENGPSFFPNPPLASDEPAVIKNFDPERPPKLDFVLPAISQTDANAKPTPPPEAPRSRFHDPKALDARWDATDDGFDYTPEMKAEVYNRIGIAREYGETVDDIIGIYPVLRGQYGHEVLGNYDISEIELDRHFRDDAKFKKDLENAVADMPGRIVADILGDLVREQSTPVEDGYRRWKADHSEYGTSVSDSDVLEAAQLYHTEIRAKLLPYARQLRDLNDLLAWRTGQTAQSSNSTAPDAPAVRERLLDTLAEMPADLRKLIYIGVADGANRLGYLDDKDVGSQFYELLGRNINILTDAALNVQEIDADARLKLLQSNAPLYRSGNGEIFRKYFPDSWADEPSTQLGADERKRVIEETQHKLARLGVERELRNLADTGYDPIRNKHEGIAGFLETALYGTASSAGYTGLAMLPGGAYLAMAAAGSNSYKTLRLEHPEISIADARNIAAFSGVIQGSMERVQGRALLGKFPALERMMNKWANPVLVGQIPRTAARAVVMTAGENFVEGAQDLTTPFIQDMAHALQKDIPDVNWSETLAHWASERADVAAGLSLMLVASLFGIHSRERRMLNSPEQRQKLLELTGFSPEQISRIEQGGTVEEKLAKAREELANRNQKDISRGAKLYQAELDAANAKHFDPEQTKTLSPTLMMSKQSEVTPADIGRHWMKIAEDPDTAILGETPTEKDFRPILEKLAGPDAQNVEIQEEKLPSGEPSGIVNFREGPRNNIVLDMSNPDEIYINSQYAGEMGTPIYQAIYAWAHNNGKQIVGDPAGLSGIAELRRTSQMLNNALRFGTTRHVLPHPSQKIEGWRTEDSKEATEHNIGLLAMREAQIVRERLPELSGLRYADSQFYDGTKAISSGDRDSHIGSRIEALDPDFAQGAGPRTVARALVTAAAQRSGDRTGGLVGTASEKASLGKIRYSKAGENISFSENSQYPVDNWAPEQSGVFSLSFSKTKDGKSLPDFVNGIRPIRARSKFRIIRSGEAAVLAQAQRDLESLPEEVATRDGRRVKIQHPAQGTVETLVTHLATSVNKRTNTTYADSVRAGWIPRIAQTLQEARVKVPQQNGNQIYITSYDDGYNHFVVVKPDGTIDAHGSADALWTQWARKKGEFFGFENSEYSRLGEEATRADASDVHGRKDDAQNVSGQSESAPPAPKGQNPAAPTTVKSATTSPSAQAKTVNSWVGNTTKNWRSDIRVLVHESASAIPDVNLRRTVLEEGGLVEGFYNPADGSIHILADRMKSQADVQRVLRHEGMHWAFANVLKKEYQELLAGSIAKIPDDRLDELLAKYPNASDAMIVEEYFAYEGQNNPKSTTWRNFVYETKLLLRKVFGDRVEFTDKDILAFLSKANRRLEDGKAPKTVQTQDSKPSQFRYSKGRDERIPIVRGAATVRSFKEAETWLRENLVGKEIDVPGLGGPVIISNQSASKLATSAGKSSSAVAHIAAVQTIPALAKTSVVESHADRAADRHIAAIHRLYAPMELDGNIFRVKMTVKEYDDASRKLYALEAVEIEAPASFRDKSLMEPTNALSGGHAVDAGSIKVSELLP